MNTEDKLKLEECHDIFRKLAYFTAPPALGHSDLPQQILDNLVEQVLSSQHTAITLVSIVGQLKSQLKLNYSEEEVAVAIQRLIKKGLVVKNENKYSSEIKRKAQLVKVCIEKIEHEKQIVSKLVEKIKQNNPSLKSNELKEIEEDFKIFLANFFLLAGAEAVRLIYGNLEEIKNLITKIEKKDIFDLLPKRLSSLREIEVGSFSKFIELLSEEEKLYLQDLLDRSLQYFTITIDKKCEALLINDFTNWNLFVDTNFIYNLLGLNRNAYSKKHTELMLQIGEKAGISFFVSPVTLEEFNQSVLRAKKILLENKLPKKYYEIAAVATDNAILATYANLQKELDVSPTDFLGKIENVKEILKVYNICEGTEYSKSIRSDKSFETTVSSI